MGLGLAATAAAWWSRLPRLVAVNDGPVEALGVSVGKDIPARFGPWSGLSTPGHAPVRLFFRVPGIGRNVGRASSYDWREPDETPKNRIAARLVLPNGSTAPLDVQIEEDRLLVDLRGDIPPTLGSLALEITVPGRSISRFRLTNPNTGSLAFDVDRRATTQGSVSGEAWWQPQEKGSATSALFGRLRIAGLRVRTGEIDELHYRTEGPFTERGHEPWIRAEGSLRIDPSRSVISQWSNTPYAGYAKALRSTGTVRRYRIFDETIDLGTAALRPRRRQYGSPNDATPVLNASRTATTPGGLCLTIPARSLEDNTSYATGMTVSVPFEVDRASVARGLPPDMARLAARSPVELSIKPIGRKEEWFTALNYEPRLREPNVTYSPYTTFSDVAPKRIATFPLRFRVRRQVLVESTPFDLTLPVVGPRHIAKYRRGGGGSIGVF